MIELVAFSKKTSSPVNKGQPVAGYNFSSGVSTGTKTITVANTSGNITSLPATLNPYTQTLSTTNKEFAITPLTAMDCGTGDFTIEFPFYCTQTTAGYSIFLFSNNASGDGYQIRIGDAGYGNRLQVTLHGNTTTANFSISAVRGNLANKWNHVAFQRRSGKVMVYLNGSKQGLAVYQSTDYSSTEQSSTQNITSTTTLKLGYSSYPANAYIPEFAYYDKAVYTDNFTPTYPLYTAS